MAVIFTMQVLIWSIYGYYFSVKGTHALLWGVGLWRITRTSVELFCHLDIVYTVSNIRMNRMTSTTNPAWSTTSQRAYPKAMTLLSTSLTPSTCHREETCYIRLAQCAVQTNLHESTISIICLCHKYNSIVPLFHNHINNNRYLLLKAQPS